MARPRQQIGKRISASIVNNGPEALDQLDAMTVAPGLDLSRGKAGIVMRIAGVLFDIRIGVTSGSITSGSLASPSSGSVTLAKWTGSGFSTSGMPSLTAINIWSNSSTAIGASKTVIMVRIAGQWVIFGWDC